MKPLIRNETGGKMNAIGKRSWNIGRLIPHRIAGSVAMIAALASGAMPGQSQANLKYQEPPQTIVNLVDVRPTPRVILSPGEGQARKKILIESMSGLPSI